jgi:hypothetical protein
MSIGPACREAIISAAALAAADAAARARFSMAKRKVR